MFGVLVENIMSVNFGRDSIMCKLGEQMNDALDIYKGRMEVG